MNVMMGSLSTKQINRGIDAIERLNRVAPMFFAVAFMFGLGWIAYYGINSLRDVRDAIIAVGMQTKQGDDRIIDAIRIEGADRLRVMQDGNREVIRVIQEAEAKRDEALRKLIEAIPKDRPKDH